MSEPRHTQSCRPNGDGMRVVSATTYRMRGSERKRERERAEALLICHPSINYPCIPFYRANRSRSSKSYTSYVRRPYPSHRPSIILSLDTYHSFSRSHNQTGPRGSGACRKTAVLVVCVPQRNRVRVGAWGPKITHVLITHM